MQRLLITVLFLFILPAITLAMDWQTTTLDNGLKVMILENRQVPQVNISTTVKVGAKNETDYFNGATHLLEHLILFRGTEEMTGEELGDAMTKHGAYFNGYTSSDWTDFVITLPKENFDFALKIHSDMLFRSNFPKEAMDQERQAVCEEININEDSPSGQAYYGSLKDLYGNHQYAHSVLGTQEKVLNVDRDSVYAYYKRYYAPNNMTMVIVGDIDAAQALEKVKHYFADFPKGWDAEDIYNPPPKLSKIIENKIVKDIGQAYMMMSTLGPKVDSPDQFTLDIMATLLGSGESSRLWKNIIDEQGLAYSVSYSFYTSKYEGMLLSFAVMDPSKVDEVEKTINETLNDVIANGFTERELRKAKNLIKTNYYTGQERGLDLADNYAQYDSHIGYEFIQNYPDNIEKVTLAQLNEAAKTYLNTEAYVKTMVVPQ